MVNQIEMPIMLGVEYGWASIRSWVKNISGAGSLREGLVAAELVLDFIEGL